VFRCFKVVDEDFDAPERVRTVSGLDDDDGTPGDKKAFPALLRLLEASALASEQHEELRRNLILGAWESIEELLEAAFNAVRGHSGKGAGGFPWEDLKNVMSLHGIHTTDQELNCLWHRYAGGTKVASVETPYGRFCDMLRPFQYSEKSTTHEKRASAFRAHGRGTIYTMPSVI
jgi:hypothetical protein